MQQLCVRTCKQRLEFVQADEFNGRRVEPQCYGHVSKDRLRKKVKGCRVLGGIGSTDIHKLKTKE